MFLISSKKILLVLLVLGFPIIKSQDFSYDGNLGPDHWGEQYNACDGKHQSPINIDILKVKKVSFPPLIFTGFNKSAYTADLYNNGHTVLVTMDFKDKSPVISGGPLNDSYIFAQFHFHWGENDTFGSEDLINNQSFPVELHMVFYKQKFQNFNNAVKYPDGVVVLAYFYELANESNPAYIELTSLVETIVKPESHSIFVTPPKVKDLISDNLQQYFTYSGSLTTPPCSEVVTWIDFEKPIPISSEQIRNFRNLYTHNNERLTHNFRPIQPLNGRIVYHNDPANRRTTTARPFDGNTNDILADTSNDISVTPNQAVLPIKKSDDIDKLLVKKNKKLKSNSSIKISPTINSMVLSLTILYKIFCF